MSGPPPPDLLDQGWRLALSGAFDEARDLVDRALQRHADPPGWLLLARILRLAGDAGEAARILDTALAAYPDHGDLWTEAAGVAVARRRPSEALVLADEALRLQPRAGLALRERGNACNLLGRLDAALECWRQALAIDPHDRLTASNIAYASAFDPAMTTAGVRSRQHDLFPPQPGCEVPGAPLAAAGRPLHVGYVSACFHAHAVARVFVPVIERHDRQRVRITCYAATPRRDAMTVRLRLAVDGWRSLAGLDTAAAAALIRQDGVDVLIDLDGHGANNRLDVFAARAAPVQVSAWGYLPGAGTPGVDALLTDRVLIPAGERALFRERLLDVPCPSVIEPPAAPQSEGRADDPARIRLGCFGRGEKLSDLLLGLWAEIMSARPTTVLVLKDDLYADPAVRARVVRAFARTGVEETRLEFQGRENHAAYLKSHQTMDLALDSYPYSGGLVTLDALSQGVPVLTLRGPQVASRTTASVLSMLEMDELVADTPQAYVALALGLIDHPGRRADLCARLRQCYRGRMSAALDRAARDYQDALLELARSSLSGRT